MEYEDRVTIPTPEGVELDLTLAGLGSRFIAAFLDAVLRGVLLVALALALLGASALTDFETDGGIALAVFIIASFLVVIAYDIFFEVLASGRTPGKRWSGLRVVRVGGHPITFVPSAVRNLVRLVDWLPASYVIGSIAILVSPRNQRLGDIAAGTLVVRDRTAAPAPAVRSYAFARPGDPADVTWDVSAVTAEEFATIRQFLERRHDLEPGARAELASTIADRMRPKVAGADEATSAEAFLERLAAVKAARS